MDYDEVKAKIQSYIYDMNMPSRVPNEPPPFSNSMFMSERKKRNESK